MRKPGCFDFRNPRIRNGWIIAIITLVPLAVVVPYLTYLQLQQSAKRLRGEGVLTSTSDDFFFDSDRDAILVSASISSIDVSGVAKMNFKFFPFNSLNARELTIEELDSADEAELAQLRFSKKPVNITVADRLIKYDVNAPWTEQDIPIAFESGESSRYPFDDYALSFFMAASTFNNENRTTSVPIYFATMSYVPLFEIFPSFPTFPKEDVVVFQATCFRSRSTKFFSIFVMVVMWILALSIFSLATGVWVRGRKVEPPTIAAGVAMLFSLPAIRSTQPGVPVIGAITDFVSFYWCMILAAISATLLLLNYIFSYKGEPLPVRKDNTLYNMN